MRLNPSVVDSLALQSAPIGWDYLTPDSYRALGPDGALYPAAAVIHGNFAPPPRPWPQIHSHLPPLDGPPRVEVLFAADTPAFAREGRFEIAACGDVLIGAGRLEDARGHALADGADQFYDELLHLIDARGYPHLLRLWNVLEHINREEDGLERYRHFCVGRHAAFMRHRADLAERYPAASAIGSESGGLSVWFVAARNPGNPIENPNQVSAFRYPAQYGPQSPSFSRALVKPWRDGATLFVSGTASITGHETRHAGDLAAQIDRTADNLETLVRAAADASGAAFRLDAATSIMKAYVRRPDDYAPVRDRIAQRLGREAAVLYLRADVCRTALLVEVDGTLFA
jgi:chorismate lyase/3-hydroxybenzoate synthase